MSEKLENVVAATAFCRGFTPGQLEGVTLAEVVEALQAIDDVRPVPETIDQQRAYDALDELLDRFQKDQGQ